MLHIRCACFYTLTQWRRQRGREKMCIFNENKKKNNKDFCVRCMPHSYNFSFDVFRSTSPTKQLLFWSDVLVAVAIVFALGP